MEERLMIHCENSICPKCEEDCTMDDEVQYNDTIEERYKCKCGHWFAVKYNVIHVETTTWGD